MPTPIEKIFEDVQLHVNFTQASSRSNIVTYDPNDAEPENISTAFGKLSKWYEALVPTGGSSGKILAWNSDGTAKWSDPLHPTITLSADTTSTPPQLSHGGTFTAITSATRDGNGHVTKINTATYTLPAQYTHPTYTRTDTTSTASPAHGETFTVIDSVTSTNGHVTAVNVKTVTLPSDQNTDIKVTQSQTTTTNYRPILFGAKNSTDVSTLADTITDGAFTSTKMYAQPSTGLIFCTGRQIENVSIQTGSTKIAHITLQTLMTWLITTKTYIPSGKYCHVIISTTWAYANNDILQVSIGGTNYEIQLAGVIIEFIGNATSYNAGMFRLLIHSSPETSFTPASGYTQFPTSHIAEYTCNGSGYSPTWKMITDLGDTIAIAHGGTGATTRLNALKNLTNENVGTSATYFLTITDSWGKGGYSSVANVKSVLGLNATVNSGTENQLAYYSGTNAISATHNGTNTGDSLYFKTGTNAKSARQIILGVYGQTYGNDAAALISGTAGVFSYGDGGPQIDFNTSSTGSQAGALIFTDHDSAAAGASWHFVSNQTDWNVTSKRFHARTSISIGTSTPNTSYNLYVSGTTNITGNTTIGGTLQTNITSASAGVNANTANSSTAGGLSLYSTNPDNYGIIFRGTSQKGKHGYVTSDWATYFTMNDSGTRGWIFTRNASSPANVASISGAGNAVFNGSVTVGGNAANTSGCRLTYNSSTQSLDFIFA